MIYTHVSLEDVREALRNLDAGTAAAVEPLAGGFANSNFLVHREDGAPLVLKIWNNRTPAEVDRLCTIADHLAGGGVRTPAPLRGPDGSAFVLVQGRAWMLQPYVPGGWLEPNPESMHALGVEIARLHAVEPTPALPQGLPMGFELMDDVLRRAGAHVDLAEHPFVQRLQRERSRLAERLPKLPTGIVHGDIFPDNVIADADRILAILDFEEACIDCLALDLAMCVVGCGWSDGRRLEERWQALRAGYETMRPLEPAEHAAMGELERYATLAIATWRFDQFAIRHQDLGQSDRYLEMCVRLDSAGGAH